MNLIEKLHKMFPLTRIIVSSLLPRGDQFIKRSVQFVNDFLCGVCSADPIRTFMRNNNIRSQWLVDNKHVNGNGFKTLLSNIKFTLFGKEPYI